MVGLRLLFLESGYICNRRILSGSFPQVRSSKLQPSFVGDLEVHDCEEWVHLVLLLDDAVGDLFSSNDLCLSLLFSGLQEDLELGSQLIDLHSLVQLHVSILLSHASVKQLIEVNIPIVVVDCHFEHLLLQLSVIEIFLTESKTVVFVSEIAKSSEEASQLIFFDLVASIPILSQFFPDLHKAR